MRSEIDIWDEEASKLYELESMYEARSFAARKKANAQVVSPIIVRDGKDYVVDLPADIRKEGETALKILREKLTAAQNSKEYKNTIQLLKSSGVISSAEAGAKLTDITTKEIVDYYDGWYYNVGFTSDMSQDVLYGRVDGAAYTPIYKIVADVVNEAKNDRRIAKLPHFSNIFSGDDFYAIDVLFKICEKGKENIREYKRM